jgi:hypothetical protein
MNQNKIKWIIFFTSMILFPSFFYLILDFAIWPVMYTFASGVVIPLLEGAIPSSLLLFAINFIFWFVALYVVSNKLAQKIATQEKNKRLVLTSLVVIVIALIGTTQIYDGGPNANAKSSAFTLYESLFWRWR